MSAALRWPGTAARSATAEAPVPGQRRDRGVNDRSAARGWLDELAGGQRAMHEVPAEDNAAELVWVRPKWSKRDYELRRGQTVVASLRWARGTHAVARWDDGPQYEFGRTGWLRQRIVIDELGAAAQVADGEPLATFLPHGGMLRLRDGRTYLWRGVRRLSRERLWTDGSTVELVRFRPTKRAGVVVSSQSAAAALPELPLLLALGQYLIALAGQDAEAASTAALVAVIASS